MTDAVDTDAREVAEEALAGAFAAWGERHLADAVRVEFSARMRTSLGRCYPVRQLIRLNGALREAAAVHTLREVVVHEAAHVMALSRYGPEVRPHGPEWAGLMAEAGLPPRTDIPCDVELGPRNGGRASTTRYEHRCPVCQTVRLASRPVRAWRCADCVSAGLSGEMQIRSLAAGNSPKRSAP